MPVLTYLHQLFNAALILDSRVVELRIVYTDGIPFHEPLQESNGAGQHHESDCALIGFRGRTGVSWFLPDIPCASDCYRTVFAEQGQVLCHKL
jgi:hypothetical protein